MEALGPQQDRNVQNNLEVLIASGLFTFKSERLHTCNVPPSLEEKNQTATMILQSTYKWE